MPHSGLEIAVVGWGLDGPREVFVLWASLILEMGVTSSSLDSSGAIMICSGKGFGFKRLGWVN